MAINEYTDIQPFNEITAKQSNIFIKEYTRSNKWGGIFRINAVPTNLPAVKIKRLIESK
jgi:hypothetical protein